MMCPHMENLPDTFRVRSSPDPTFTKPNELLVMVPVVGKLSPVSRKLFNALLYSGGDEYRTRLDSGSPMRAEETFEAKLSDLVAHLPGEASDWSSNASAHLLEMKRTEVMWQSIDRNADTSEWGVMNLLSQAEILKKGKALYVRWAFPPRVLSALKDPAFFTRLNLEIVGSLRSYAAIALYEICSRYRTNPSGLTCSQPPDWWVEALTARSVRPPPPTGRGKSAVPVDLEQKPRREWRKVKSESVLDAIKEINAKSDLEIELIEERSGKAVSRVQFAVRRKRRLVPVGQGVAADIIEKAVALNISAADIASIARSVRGGPDVLRAALKKLAERAAREDLVPLSNTLAYLKVILGDLDEYVEVVESPPPTTTPTEQPAILPRSTETAGIVDVSETPESLARKQVESLARPEQEELAAVAIEWMKEKRLATASVMHAYAKYLSGGPLAGVLLGEMTRQHLKRSAVAPN